MVLKDKREKGKGTYNGRPIRITPDYSTGTFKARRAWEDVFQESQQCPPRIIYSE